MFTQVKYFFQKILKKKPSGTSVFQDKKYYLIEEYQFQNLIINRVPCLAMDLRKQVTFKVPRSVSADEATAVEYVTKNATKKEHPIVLFCEDGLASVRIAEILSHKKYFNVVVLKDGVNSLTEDAKRLIGRF